MISVLIIDDSPTICKVLNNLIGLHPKLEVVGCARNAYEAKEQVNNLQPDVITLDIEMPDVDGLTFLDRLMKARPTRVLMLSSLTQKNAQKTLEALELGALDFIPKSQLDLNNTGAFAPLLHNKIMSVAKAEIPSPENKMPIPGRDGFSYANKQLLIAIGASTGGTEAIKHILSQLPENFPPVIIALHMPAGFTESYAKRLDSCCALNVHEAIDGQTLSAGHAYIAPGEKHLRIKKHASGYIARVDEGEKVSGHRPSVDAMLSSVAEHAGKFGISILLTGMGRDGADGLLKVKQMGGYTLVQDEASCVVYGMPKEAVKIGAQCEQLPLNNISVRLMSEVKRRRK